MNGRLIVLTAALLALAPLAHADYRYDPIGDQTLTWHEPAALLFAGNVECEDPASDLDSGYADRSYDASRLVLFADVHDEEGFRCSAPGLHSGGSEIHFDLAPAADGTGLSSLSAKTPVAGPAVDSTWAVAVLEDGSSLHFEVPVYRNGTFVRVDVPVALALATTSYDMGGADVSVLVRASTPILAPGLGTVGSLDDEVGPLSVPKR